MAIKKIETTKFMGGISPFQKQGIEGSFRWSSHLNIHQDPNYVTLFPAGSKVSSTTVTDLVKWIVDGSPFDSNRYAYSDTGAIYKITSSDVFSLLRSGVTIGNGAVGQGLCVFDDYMYYITSTTIGRYGKLSGTPTFNDDVFTDGTTNIDQSSTTTGQTYTLPTAIAETALARKSFIPTTDPLKSIQVSINTVGTGDVTLTLHDQNNVSLGAATIAHASLTTGFNTFTFSAPVRLTIGNTYHFHVTVSTGTSKVDTSTASDLTTVAYKTVFGILLTDATFHDTKEFLNMLCVCNEEYLATFDRALYMPNKLTFKRGFIARKLTIFKEFLVIACYKGTDVTSTEDARLYFWDGYSSTFNFSVPVSMGFPHFVHSKFNKLIGMYGSSASLNIGSDPFIQIQDIPSLADNKYVEIYPGAVTEWQTKSYIGIAGTTNDNTLNQGIYEYGSLNQQYSDVLNYVASISTGTSTGTSMKIGCVFGIGDSMYWSWKDGSSYGVDKVTKSSTAATSGEYESLIFDNDTVPKQKNAMKLVIEFLPLASGETVTPKYKLERATSFTPASTVSTTSSTRASIVLPGRFKEIEYGFTVTSSEGTFPKVTAVYFEYDDLSNEVFSE